MKRCPVCTTAYENSMNQCPTCGTTLEWLQPEEENNPQQWGAQNPVRKEKAGAGNSAQHNNMYLFEQVSGNRVIINGAVTDSSTQQYYQSKLTKFLRAVFSGEPYQLSHTTFETVFRVEEHVTRGYPEQARDVTIYGGIQNIFSVGDDVTVTAKQKRDRLIATNVFNHSINSAVRVKPNIPAGLMRLFLLVILAAVVFAVYSIATMDYAAMGNAMTSVLLSLVMKIIPIVIVVWIVWLLIKAMIKG